MYLIHARIDLPMKFKAADSLGFMQELVDIPKFFVKAGSREDALVKAKLIVDPGRMVDTTITAEEEPKEPYRAALEGELDAAVKALNSDDINDAELDAYDALRDLAEGVARYLGRDFDALMTTGEEEEG